MAKKFTLKQQFPYVIHDQAFIPYLPLTLFRNNYSVTAMGLVDSGATINVLPYQFGLDLGGIWNDSLANLHLAGNLANLPACPFIVHAVIGNFKPIKLAFGWIKTDTIPLILGQVNFFDEFNICFYRNKHIFELTSKPNIHNRLGN